jgi:hypothetical protein
MFFYTPGGIHVWLEMHKENGKFSRQPYRILYNAVQQIHSVGLNIVIFSFGLFLVKHSTGTFVAVHSNFLSISFEIREHENGS